MPPPTAKRPGLKQVQVMKSLFQYQAERPDELSFKEDELIIVISKDNPDWWLCKIGDKQGLVPASYRTLFNSGRECSNN